MPIGFDSSAYQNIYKKLIPGENGVLGNIYYQNTTDSKFYKADNTSYTTSSGFLALTKGNVTANIQSSFIVSGGSLITTGLVLGPYYIGTSGNITPTEPSGSIGSRIIIRIIGYAISSTELMFMPENSYMEL